MNKWVVVPGFHFIEVTRCGRVRSVERTVIAKNRWGTNGTRTFPSREYAPWLSDNGYLRVVAHDPTTNKRRPMYVHRLIAFAFVEGYETGFHVNHIDGKKTNNDPSNLEWVPNEENVSLAWRTGLAGRYGTDVWCAKLTPRRVHAIRRMLANGATVTTIAIGCDVSKNTIQRIKDGVAWIHV